MVKPLRLDESYGLNSGHIESLSATDIFAPHHIVTTNHIALCLGESRTVPVVGSPWHLGFFAPYQPAQLIFFLLSAMRTGHPVRTLFRPLIEKISLFHRAPRRGLGRLLRCVVRYAALANRVLHNRCGPCSPQVPR
jgi:hypothetical protein